MGSKCHEERHCSRVPTPGTADAPGPLPPPPPRVLPQDRHTRCSVCRQSRPGPRRLLPGAEAPGPVFCSESAPSGDGSVGTLLHGSWEAVLLRSAPPTVAAGTSPGTHAVPAPAQPTQSVCTGGTRGPVQGPDTTPGMPGPFPQHGPPGPLTHGPLQPVLYRPRRGISSYHGHSQRSPGFGDAASSLSAGRDSTPAFQARSLAPSRATLTRQHLLPGCVRDQEDDHARNPVTGLSTRPGT